MGRLIYAGDRVKAPPHSFAAWGHLPARSRCPGSFASLVVALLLCDRAPAVLAHEADGRAAAPALAWNVRDFGAAGDGSRLDTAAIQSAIDACGAAGGGAVRLPSGRYRSGTITLRDNVTLLLERECVLLGSPNLDDYPPAVPAYRSFTDTYTNKSLIYAERVRNVGILGEGTIDGQGSAFKGPYRSRPYLLRFVECRNVSLKGIRLRDSAMWVQHYLACEDVTIEGIAVRSVVNANNDGIDIDGCSRVRIADCVFDTGDDSICLKSTSPRPCRDVTIERCAVRSDCNGLKLGTESTGGFENIRIRGCTVRDTRMAGIALEIVDGGALDRVDIEDVQMENVGAPLVIRLGNRGRPFTQGAKRPCVGTLQDVSIRNVRATGAGGVGCSITGLPGHCVERVRLSHLRFAFGGGGGEADARRDVPEKPEAYPEFDMFGVLPAYGVFCRHVRGLSLEAVALSTARPDRRPPFVFDDVDGLTRDDAGAADPRPDAPASPAGKRTGEQP